MTRSATSRGPLVRYEDGGHLGFELLPAGFRRHWLLRWHNTTTHHDMHHQHVNGNYSLYFNFWDRVMRTNHPDY